MTLQLAETKLRERLAMMSLQPRISWPGCIPEQMDLTRIKREESDKKNGRDA